MRHYLTLMRIEYGNNPLALINDAWKPDLESANCGKVESGFCASII